jgi:hypothetical protein
MQCSKVMTDATDMQGKGWKQRKTKDHVRQRDNESIYRQNRQRTEARGERERSGQLRILKQEVPVDGDFGRTFRAPAEAKYALARLLAPRLRFASVDVPHAERNLTGGVHDDLVLLTHAGIPSALLLLLVRVRGADVDVRVWLLGAREPGDDGWPARLRELHVREDAVREPGREARALAVRRAVDVALEVRGQPDGDVGVRGRVYFQMEFG